MRAYGIESYGDSGQLKQLELSTPEPGPAELLVRVEYSSVNPADIRARSPSKARLIEREFPVVLGYDVAGIVASVGSAVTGFAPGDAVLGSPSLLGAGADAEYVRLDYRVARHKPRALGFAEAAALPLAGVTALECLERALRIRNERQVLVHGGAGGVGHLQIQIAKALGLEVWTTAGHDDSVALCRDLGADHVIDYRRDTLAAAKSTTRDGRGWPLIMDNVGGAVLEQSMAAIAPMGVLVTIVPTPSPRIAELLFLKAATLVHHVMGAETLWGLDAAAQGGALGRLLALVERGKVRPHIEACYPIRDLAAAHRHLERGRTRGKVVVQVRDGW